MKALVVEDEAVIALALADTIEAAGHEVIGTCCSLEQAVALTQDAAPDFAFVDLRLGNKRCGATVERYLSETFGTTCIYVTGNVEFAYKYRARAIGFLEKPVSEADLLETMAFISDLRSGRHLRRMPRRLQLFERPEPPAVDTAPSRVAGPAAALNPSRSHSSES